MSPVVRRCAVLAAALLPLGLAACSGSGQTTTVARGNVSTSLTASGTLQHVTERNLGFQSPGKITQVAVTVGQRVKPGDILAKIDDTPQQLQLRKARDQVTIAQAALGKVKAVNGAATSGAETPAFQNLVDSAQRAQKQIKDQADARIRTYQRTLDFEQKELRRQLKQLDIDEAECDAQTSGDSGLLPSASVDTPADDNGGFRFTACQNAEQRRDVVASVRRNILTAQNNIKVSKQQRDVEVANQQVNIDEYRRDLAQAQSRQDLSVAGRPFDITTQEAVLDQTQADAAAAQTAVEATIIQSSYNGVVDRINGRVGEVIPAAYHVPEAGGRPDGSAAVGSGGSAAPAGITSVGPDNGAVIVLKNIDAWEVTVPYSVADASHMQVEQAAELSFPTVPDLTLRGTVSSIEAAGPDGKQQVTVVLSGADPRATDNLATDVHVVLGTIKNVLTIPTAAVRGSNGRTGTVTVEQDGDRRDAVVQIGAVGDTSTEVVSGLREGDKVVTLSASH